jgi:polyisoprenoid-binding protein YceI
MANFQIQKSSSTVNWTGKKVLGLHTGSINLSGGTIDIANNTINGGQITIDMRSIVVTDIDDAKTNREFKDHLFHDDFFAVDKFPTSHLLINNSALVGNNEYKLEGVLTIKDISHPISFTAKVEIFTATLHALGEMAVDRTLYNIRYGSGKFIDNLGDKLIYDDFVLQFKLVAQRVEA